MLYLVIVLTFIIAGLVIILIQEKFQSERLVSKYDQVMNDALRSNYELAFLKQSIVTMMQRPVHAVLGQEQIDQIVDAVGFEDEPGWVN